MYSFKIHHPFAINTSSVYPQRMMRFYTSLISSIPRLIASSFIGIKWW